MMPLLALIDLASTHWVAIVGLLHILVSSAIVLHILLYKENERTSLAWIGLVVLSPFLGSLFYWIFGINRIKRHALRVQAEHAHEAKKPHLKVDCGEHYNGAWKSVMRAGLAIDPNRFSDGNTVQALINGDEAYPAMLHSISRAKHHIVLSSYIFEYDKIGRDFVEALSQAHARGVDVKVLLDGIGVTYSWRKADRFLKRRGVKTARFLPAISLKGIRLINLRNHRKILCVDGTVAYLGGINIHEENMLANSPKHPVDDIHFKIEGPVIDQVSAVFSEDWYYATQERTEFPQFAAKLSRRIAPEAKSAIDKQPTLGSPPQDQHRSSLTSRADSSNSSAKCDAAKPMEAPKAISTSVVARIIQDGPDSEHKKTRWALINALNRAEHSAKIITPYFVPDHTLMTAIQGAALRGVCVDILVPHRSNILFFNWAMSANFSKLVKFDVRLYLNLRPFDHSKMVVIDKLWSFIGSSNWDARSLELNFEINLECYDTQLGTQLDAFFDHKKNSARLVLAEDIEKTPVLARVRNNFFRLFSSYL